MNNPTVTVMYVHVSGSPRYAQMAGQFVASYITHPPDYPHKTLVVCNGGGPDTWTRRMYDRMKTEVEFLAHDNTGHDIGAYLKAAKIVTTDIIACFGSHCFFNRRGWLRRIVDAWEKYGPGLYGAFASYQIMPHLQTMNFWCPPDLLRRYPLSVVTKEERYRFEHFDGNFWQCVAAEGLPVKLVTWDGEYDWPQWRTPANIVFRGDQSNCLLGSRLTRAYERSNPRSKRMLAYWADTLTVPDFKA